jgi:hypothetical protein
LPRAERALPPPSWPAAAIGEQFHEILGEGGEIS